MDENGKRPHSAGRVWLKRAGIALGILVLLLVVFHRPILQTVVRRVAIHFAAKENLKLDLRVEGSILGGIVLRNVHAVATGPSALQSADVDQLRVDYSLLGYLRGGMAELLQDVEVRNASVVLDPAKAPQVEKPEEQQKFTLPAFFPDRLTLHDVDLRMNSEPQDLVVQDLYLQLHPESAGELRIGKLQIPNGRSWTDLTAQTTYENRNLFIRNLNLDEQTQLAEVNIDASQIGQNKLEVGLKGKVAGGDIETSLSLGGKAGSVESNIDLSVENTSIDAVRGYFQTPGGRDVIEEGAEAAAKAVGAAATTVSGDEKDAEDAAKASAAIPPGISGDVKRLVVKGSGTANRPQTWNGTIEGEVENLAAGGVTFDRAKIDVKAADGRAQINNVELKRGANEITLSGSAELPETTEGFGHVPAQIQLNGKLPDLGEITAGMPQPITGSAEINGQVRVANDTVIADIVLAGGPIDFGPGTAQKFVVRLNATKQMPPQGEQRPYFHGLTSDVRFEVSEVRAKDYAVDAIAGHVRSAGRDLQIEQMQLTRADNTVKIRGTYQLPVDFSRAAEQPAHVAFAVDAPHVGAFWASEALVTGALQANGALDYQQQLGPGYFEVFGTDLRAKNLTIPELSLQGTTASNTVFLNDLTAKMNERDYVSAHGQVQAAAPYPYSGALNVDVANLSTFEPILKAAGNDTDLAGSLLVNWQGSGEITNFDNTGKLHVAVDDGRFGNLDDLEVKIDANYTPEVLSVPIVYISSDKLMFQAIMEARGETLEITKIQVVQGEAKYADGYLSVPFVWENVGSDRPLFPPDGKVMVNFQTENLDINKLAKDVGMDVPVSGLADIKIDAQGTLDDLRATLDLRLSALRSEKLEDFTPATFALNARIENDQLTIDGRLEQARIEPVQISATVPLPVAEIVANKKIDEQTPVRAQVQMPRSSVNFVRQFVPALQRVDGNMALDVNVGGTIANPTFSGAADMTINSARLANPSLPTVTNFNARLVFDGDSLNLQQFRGELAGGPFNVSGQITFPKLTEPNLNLQVRADAVLVARNDDLTARTDANVSIVGPFNSAAVTGQVALTNSKFLKNIDLIPIGVPGRPPPAPEPPAAEGELTLPEPLAGWTFDLAITTKDPFLIRGNLANGGALVDMKITGTGAEPIINGSVRLQNVEATLPFSRLEITQGFIYFNPDDPFNPGLDLQGVSLIRDYTVRVYVYGTVDAPEAVFTSEPPLPQEEIISLLATGTTREELASGGNVLAGRALILLGQQLYQKIFKKGKSEDNTNSFFDRLQVDVGGVDPRTGQQTATARYRATDQIQVIGEIGVQGDFRGTVKYLIRFR